MDIGKIIKDIKYLKLLTRFKLNPDIETKFQINHCNKNIIDIDKLWSNYTKQPQDTDAVRRSTLTDSQNIVVQQ